MENLPILRALDTDHAVATWERTLIQIWRRTWTAAAMAETRRIALLFIAEQAQPITLLYIIEVGSQVPSAPVRKEFGQLIEETAAHVASAAVVAEGGEFRAAVVRGVKASMNGLMRGPGTYKFVGTLDEALAALAPHLDASRGGPAGLRQALAELRAHIDGVSPQA